MVDQVMHAIDLPYRTIYMQPGCDTAQYTESNIEFYDNIFIGHIIKNSTSK